MNTNFRLKNDSKKSNKNEKHELYSVINLISLNKGFNYKLLKPSNTLNIAF